MLKKSLAIFLSMALALGIMVQGSFAFSSGSEDSITSLFESLFYNSSYHDQSYQALINFFDSYYSDGKQVTIGIDNSDRFRVCIHDGYLWDNGSFIRCSVSSTYYILVLYTYAAPSQVNSYPPNGSTTTQFGMTWYNQGKYNYFSSSATMYSTSRFYGNSGVVCENNLELDGPFAPDLRVLEAFRTEQYENGLPYLAIRVDDIPYSYSWVSVHFSDAYGPGTKIFDFYDMIYYPGDDYQMYLINPLDISPIEFDVDSVVYSGSLDWGYMELSDLEITFNEPELPEPVPSITPDPSYNYDFTSIVNYNGGDKDIFYNSFKVNISRYEGQSFDYYFKDTDGYLVQPFAFNFILLPYYPVQQGFVYDAFIDDCFYQYDVILSEYYDPYFDFFYGSGALSSLQTALSSYHSGSDVSQALETWYSNHSPVVYTFPYSDSSDLTHLSSNMPALMVVTDSFYFKQTNYLLGDTGDILSEFSDRFYKVGGFSDTLFSNILASYNLDLRFYNQVLPMLTSLSYWTNGLDINDSFNQCIGLLTSVDAYLSSVDGKLDLLSTIDSDLGDLLEWFQNQEDSDVTLTLPDFNPSVLINIYGENVGDFVEFVQEFVNTLPEFDFSDFPNFFDYAADLVDDTAGSGDDLIGSLFNPYDYDDSGLHEFGWD